MRFNRESGRRGIGENPRIKKPAAMPTARAKQRGGNEKSRKQGFRLFLNSLVGRE